MDPHHPSHRQFKARKEGRRGLGWWALALAIGMLGLEQWIGHDSGEEGQAFRAVAEPKAASRPALSLSERAGRDLRSARPSDTDRVTTASPGEPEAGPAPTGSLAPEGLEGSRLTTAYFQTALNGLAAQGADLSQPLPSRHLVFTRSLVAAQRMVLWGRQQGFHVEPMETSTPEPGRAHGEFLYFVPLMKVSAPRPALIAADAQRIATFAAAHGQLAYQSWEGVLPRP